MEVLRAYLRYGSTSGAASALGVTAQTVKNRLHELNARLGVKKTAQAVWRLTHQVTCSKSDHENCEI